MATDRRSRSFAPVVILLVSLVITGVATAYVAAVTRERDATRFKADVENFCKALESRVEGYAALLRSVGGLFATQQGVTQEEFKKYVEHLKLSDSAPATLGLGYAAYATDLKQIQEIAAREGIEGFSIRPVPKHELSAEGEPGVATAPLSGTARAHAVILFLEPANTANRHAIGLDMYSDPMRRAAMDKAKDSGEPQFSGPVRLIQDQVLGKSGAAGLLLFMPVSQGLNTESDARSSLQGFVYMPLHAAELGRRLLTKESALHVSVEDVTDGQSKLLYKRGEPDADAPFSTSRSFDAAGRSWHITFDALPGFRPPLESALPAVTFCGGVAISLALFLISRGQSLARSNAESLAGELRQSELALRLSEAKFRRLIDSDLIGVFFATFDGVVTDGNEAFFRMIGYSRDDARRGGISGSRITPVQWRQSDEHALSQLVQSGVCAPYEKEYIRSDGVLVPVLIGAAAMEGSAKECVAFTVDLTERKRVERELQAAKEAAEAANRAKDQFLAVLSHELRTPLTPVLAAAAAASSDKSLPEEVRSDFDMIRRNVQLEAKLIDDLLDLTRIGRGKLQLHVETVDVHQTAQAAIDVATRHRDDTAIARVEAKLSATRHFVRGDAARLQQIFWNLIQNALKFTPPANGAVTISTENDPHGLLRVIVRDNGMGIEPHVLAKIFDAFEQGDDLTTRRFGGLGLGLAITRGLVAAHGGNITADSPGRGKGASFVVELPTTVAPQPAAPTMDAPAVAAQAKLNILLVEDHSDTARILSRLLRVDGHEVTVAGSVGEAVNAAASASFDLLISDLGLPDGSGLDLIRALRANNRTWPAIALTGYGTDEDVRSTHDAGFNEHVTKPINWEQLQGTIKRVTDDVRASH